MNSFLMKKVCIGVPFIFNMKKENLLERYKVLIIITLLIQGLAATVSKCINKKTGDTFAVKIMRTDDEEKLMAAQ